ncbi:cytochrome-c peroxidase [Photobacterium proteolyticum]|nr:cytochrome c peroxidase [Photobacterium proteolyticum]
MQLALEEQGLDYQSLLAHHQTEQEAIRQALIEAKRERPLNRELVSSLQKQKSELRKSHRTEVKLLKRLQQRDLSEIRMAIQRSGGTGEEPEPDHEFNTLLELVSGVELTDENGIPVGGEAGIAVFGDKMDVEVALGGLSSARDVSSIELTHCSTGEVYLSLPPRELLGEVVIGPEIPPQIPDVNVGPLEPTPMYSLVKLNQPITNAMLLALESGDMCAPVVMASHEESHPEGALTGSFIDHLRFEALEYLLDPSLLPEPRIVDRQFNTLGTISDLVVKDQHALEKLGKAFFWDTQVGSDNKVACATCHNLAGVDWRTKNQFASGPGNQEVSLEDFPVDRVLGSQGVLKAEFVDIDPNQPGSDVCNDLDGDFRQVSSRNAPTVVDAAFSTFQFWDGRAHRFFNGENPLGPVDINAGVYKVNGSGYVEKDTNFLVDFASLASQAVGPAESHVEMACGPENRSRYFPQLATKLLDSRVKPLGLQKVHSDDSLLGGLANGTAGLNTSYESMIKNAFRDEYWDSAAPISLQHPVTNEWEDYSMMEANFAFIFGMAVQAYERTLLSGESKFDKFARGEVELTEDEEEGFNRFLSGGTRCNECHDGPLFTTATLEFQLVEPIEAMRMVNSVDNGLYDSGFYNVGIRPAEEDLGRGRQDLPGPIALSSQSNAGNDMLWPNLPLVSADEGKASVKGHMKTPTLRNIELTAPYFHNGKYLTLEDVVAFYARGSDFPNSEDLDPGVRVIGQLIGKPERQAKIAAWMRTLTDERIRYRSAPFDHPELPIPNGHKMENGQIIDDIVTLEATGKDGTTDIFATFFERVGGTIPEISEDD